MECHKKVNSKVGLKANEKGSSTETLLIETQNVKEAENDKVKHQLSSIL